MAGVAGFPTFLESMRKVILHWLHHHYIPCFIKIADSPAQAVNCTLRQNFYACPGDTLYITCATKDTHSLSWISEDYIGNAHLNISSHYHHRDLNYSDSRVVAMLSNMSTANDTLLLTSTLIITVLPSVLNHMHSITCLNVDIGTRSSVLFEMAGMCTCSSCCVMFYTIMHVIKGSM